MQWRTIWSSVALATILLAACGVDGTGLNNESRIWVVDYDIAAWQRTVAPLQGATVFFVGSTGETSATTDAQGSVVAPTTIGSPFTVHVGAPNHSLTTIEDVSAAFLAKAPRVPGSPHPGELTIAISRLDEPTTVKLSGALRGKLQSDNSVTLTSSKSLDMFSDSGGVYELAVASNDARDLVGVEWTSPQQMAPRTLEQTFLHWFSATAPAATTTMDLDLTTVDSLSPQKARVELMIPGGATGPLGGQSIAWGGVYAGTGGLFLGAPTKVAPSTDGTRFLADMEWVSPTWAEAARYYLYIAGEAGTVMRWTDGLPTGHTIDDFQLPPAVSVDTIRTGDKLTPTGLPSKRAPLDLALRIAGFNNSNVWLIYQATGDTFTLPSLPDAMKDFAPTGTVEGVVQWEEPNGSAPQSNLPKNTSVSRRFAVAN